MKEGQFAVYHDEQKEMTVKMVKELERWSNEQLHLCSSK